MRITKYGSSQGLANFLYRPSHFNNPADSPEELEVSDIRPKKQYLDVSSDVMHLACAVSKPVWSNSLI